METSKYWTVERLLDGSKIIIRSIRPDDREGFVQAFEQFAKSPESVHFRFHGFKRSISGSEATDMTEIDFVDHVALVVTRGTDSDKRLIGVGRYIVCDAVKRRAEVAFAILDEYQGRGLGTLLFRHLATIGKAQGLREFQAEVLVGNHRMTGVLESSGFPIQRSTEFGVDRVLLTISDTPEANKRRSKSS